MLILIRGVQGSGKSTLAERLFDKHYPNALHVEADMFFTDSDGNYRWRGDLVHAAHAWCRARVLLSIANKLNDPVIVSNVFARNREMVPYYDLCRQYKTPLQIITLKTRYQNRHGLTDAQVERTRRLFQELDTSRLDGIQYSYMTVT